MIHIAVVVGSLRRDSFNLTLANAMANLFDAHGAIGPSSKEFLQAWMNQYLGWVKRHTA